MLERGDVNSWTSSTVWSQLPVTRPGWIADGFLRPFVSQAREPLHRQMKDLNDIETKDVKFMTEARYNGTEIVMLAPDANATTHAVDVHVPVKVGTDAAFWLGVCKEMIDSAAYDADFIREQTDLPLLLRTDTRHFLNAADVDGGRADQLYFFDETKRRITPAPRGSLRLDGSKPALEGTYQASLQDGTVVEVRPVFEQLREHLQAYTPEKAQALCGVHSSVIREMAAKMASKRTCAYCGFNTGKHYHGDLMERSLMLALALSGNVGKPGTGFTIWSFPTDGISMLSTMRKPVAEGGLAEAGEFAQAIAQQVLSRDPDATDELIGIEIEKQVAKLAGFVPSVFWLYHHAGYKDLWNRQEWQDPAMRRSFTDFMDEAVEKGWWDGLMLPEADKPPEVLMLFGNNPLRRVRSGMEQYPQVLFPKIKTIFAVETRMSSSAAYCDYLLPAAWYYEKDDMTLSMSINPYLALIEQAAAPVGEAKPEWEIFGLLMAKLGERAAARGIAGFVDRFGQERKYAALSGQYTMNGVLSSSLDALQEMVTVHTATGVFPKDFSYEQFRKDGNVALAGMGSGTLSTAIGNEYDTAKPFYSLRWHTEEKKPYPTHARRMQFYIDHDWFLEVGEELPTHKDVPPIGGDYPFMITSGHPRVTIHSIHLLNPQLSRLHRGQPVVFMNDDDARGMGIADGETVRVFNDVNEFEIMVSRSSSVAPKQVIVYFWEPYQFPHWRSFDGLLVGQPKALYFAGGYEQLRYFFMNGSPSASIDRGVRVGIEKLPAGGTAT